MKILIEYNGKKIVAEVIGDHIVTISSKDVGLEDRIHEICIELAQCIICGVWKSEDEELYGDGVSGGLCENCCVMCDTCQQYKPVAEMMNFKTIDCNQCVLCNQIKKYENFPAPNVEVGRNDVKVMLEYIGEGFQGDFVNNGIDMPLMRMSVVKKEYVEDGIDHPDWNWIEVDNASYCTQIPVDTDEILMNDFCKIVVDRVYKSVMDEDSIKSLCRELSWANEAWIKANKSLDE